MSAAGPQRAVTNLSSNEATLTQFQAETLRHSPAFKMLPLLCTCIIPGLEEFWPTFSEYY